MRLFNTIALTVTVATAAHAGELHSADFILALDNDHIVTGAIDPDTGSLVFPSRVKSAVLGAEGFPNFTNDPGFNAQLGTLDPGMNIGFDILAAPRVWNDADAHFDDIATETLTVRAAGQNINAPTADTVVPGIVFGQATLDPAASFHHHLQYLLNGGLPPAIDGIWLLQIQLWSPSAGIDASDSLYLVFAQGDGEAQLDDAIAWVEDNLIAQPCPADFNADGTLNFFDVSAFLTAFNTADPAADLTNDGALNFFDISAFLTAFNQGCP